MKKISLDNYSIDEAVAILTKTKMIEDNYLCFTMQCDNCTLSIVAENHMNNKAFVEVSLRSVDNTEWIELKHDNGYTDEMPIISTLPLEVFPMFVKQFRKLQPDAFTEVWNAWDTISCYFPYDTIPCNTPQNQVCGVWNVESCSFV